MPSYDCLLCNFSTNLKSNYKRHINTLKHKNNENEWKQEEATRSNEKQREATRSNEKQREITGINESNLGCKKIEASLFLV